jgi:chemotaxis protein MotB
MTTRMLTLAALAAALLVLSGCSCKQFEEQIMALDAQIADLQQQLGEREAVLAECDDLTEELRRNISEAQMEHAVVIEQRDNRFVTLTLQEAVTYASSEWIVLDTMVQALETIAATIRDRAGFRVFVEGHTDDRKIIEEFHYKWPSNWELGAFRASAVTRYLINDLGLPAERFAAVSYGPFRPVADNATAEGRMKNRRVVITLEKITDY